MPLLSPDQSAFVEHLGLALGLDQYVLAAWVIAESGPNKTKANHNYLNMMDSHGQQITYASAADAASAAADNLSTPLYASILATRHQTPAATIAAIKASPWDVDHYSNGVLDRTYAQVQSGAVGLLGNSGSNPSGFDQFGLGIAQGAYGAAGDASRILDDAFSFALGGHTPAELAVRLAELVAGSFLLAAGLLTLAALLFRDVERTPIGQQAGRRIRHAAELAAAAVIA